jgi:hypothetical protein
MAVFNYRKFKVSLRSDSKKTQGLHVGDIVRRQYFDGQNIIYSLMAVLEIGSDTLSDNSQQPYFVGALLEGDAPTTSQLLDFARITNLFDTDRSGALYLTASDDQAPYMDVIDGIGRNASLSWPVALAVPNNEDSQTQYVLSDSSLATTQYVKSQNDNNRILHITKNSSEGTVTLKQDFYKYVANPNRVLISYKIKASKTFTATASLEYVDGVRVDGSLNVAVTTDWQYKFHAVTVDWSGRHLRSVKIALPGLENGDEVWISDFNIILLSSVANFADASKMRIGKLTGVVDPVFGRLDGYGGYLQKLFTSGSAHVSGTLTAGDENGFGSTFYAGKIHRNAFINSLAPIISGSCEEDTTTTNPTGVGKMYKLTGGATVTAQTSSWLNSHISKQYCFSFWVNSKKPVALSVQQNGFLIGTIYIEAHEANAWKRESILFEVLTPTLASESLTFTLIPTFSDAEEDAISDSTAIITADTVVSYADEICVSAFQLESGRLVTQYQPTDSVLDTTDDYGAWFSRGGIGGTIQNPLLKLNYDGNGSIGTRTNSFVLRVDGSGYLANNNIRWDSNGDVTFGQNVTLGWDNLSSDAQLEIVGRTIKIEGNDTMVVVCGGNNGFDSFTPQTLVLTANCLNFSPDEAVFQWQYKDSNGVWTDISGATSYTYTVEPLSSLWSDDDIIELKCNYTVAATSSYDTFTVRKVIIAGFSVKVTSSSGSSFHNGDCQTTLQAELYFRGERVTDLTGIAFRWHKYTIGSSGMVEDTSFWTNNPSLDRTTDTLVLNYAISDQDHFECVVSTTDMFTYDFPISF